MVIRLGFGCPVFSNQSAQTTRSPSSIMNVSARVYLGSCIVDRGGLEPPYR